MVDVRHHPNKAARPGGGAGEDPSLPMRAYLAFAVGAVMLVGLFWLTWRSQFAAPPGYLFDTPSQPVEAAYCLAVARGVAPGATGGGYLGEAHDFWLQRVRDFGGDLAGTLTLGEKLLGDHLGTQRGAVRLWLIEAMDACSNRALNYGAHFAAFD
ncbi:hypothetical protein [Thioclava atlantica]|uniref:Uncharacterized protein n=1 Tax=Thioclava atlantica TaxID=1317124 RepID=A0A085TYN3_9RHOB|nr:hypothetical protein [Thioclava atlantica]KFE35830.1 hypothetical protein DW2_04355 [Thioclava atlantica]